MSYTSNLDHFEQWLEERNRGQSEFIQAAREIAGDVMPIINANEDYKAHRVLYRLAEPDRIISFKVVWEDDTGELNINRGWRVQQSNLLGPYKGGLRFHPTVNESVLKFLAFEQCFKNSLTGLSLGGGKGGSDFNPKGRSEREILRFCNAFMTALNRHMGPQTDVPAGDINVGQREIGYLFGQYMRLENEFAGALTGKHLSFGGSEVREEATGFGVIFFTQSVLEQSNASLEGKRINISGAGNVATFAARKAVEEGGCVQTLSNSRGMLHVERGFENAHFNELARLQGEDNSLLALSETIGGDWHEGKKPWGVPCDIAIPCATQNELDEDDAKTLLEAGTKLLVEGANMPLTENAARQMKAADVVYVPGKASNAGGVAMSGFEMSQNAHFHQLPFDELEKKLRDVMTHIHESCVEDGHPRDGNGQVDYVRGANVAGFRRLADAVVAQGY